MNKIVSLISLLVFFMVLGAGCTKNKAETDTPEETEKTEVVEAGQPVPDFTVITLAGDTVRSTEFKGKVVLLNFFATWCGPCNAEMPLLEKDIWQVFQGPDFRILSIGREHTPEEVAAFKAEKGVTFPMAADPDRSVYSLFATQYIPRNIIVDRAGTIVYHDKGFDQEAIVAKLKELLNN